MESKLSMPGQPFVVMAKPVGSRCNLACEYCYYSSADSRGSGALVMNDALLERFLRQYIDASEGPEVPLVWHGGEPTLAGLDFFRRAMELQERYLPRGWTCRNNLQTNGILLDDKWAAFLAEFHFDVGLSIDGPEHLHDQYRKDQGGKGSWRSAAAAARRLQAHGIQPDLLCTVTSSAAAEPLAVYRSLRELDTGWIQFIPIVRRDSEGRVTPDSVSAEGYGDFLCAVFDEWALHDIGRLDVQLFAEAARVWSGGGAGLCTLAPTCGRALIVEMDGGVYSCDHFVRPEYRIGDIETGILRELVNLPEQLRFGNNKRDRLNVMCQGSHGTQGSHGVNMCPHLGLCNGGCPKDRFVTEPAADPGDEAPLNYLCTGLKRFFDHAKPLTAQIMQLARRGLGPAAIMAELRRRIKDGKRV